jgi:ATP-dependent RNA helicase RhlE
VTNPAPAPKATFRSLELIPSLLSVLDAEGYAHPTPIQSKAIPPALHGKDLLGIAQTGTGKTAAFALPILQRLTQGAGAAKPAAGRRPRVLVLAPTRELAAQIGESFATYGRGTGLRHAVVFGGVGQNPQVKAIAAGIDVLVATPGRLLDLMGQRLVSLADVQVFVLDEADRMLDMGFIQPIRKIAQQVPARRQTMLFSATMPKEIQHLADQLLHEPVRVEVTPVATTVDRIEQRLFHVAKAQKTALLVHLLGEPGVERTVVFTKTKHGADRVVRKLVGAGIRAEAIHGNKGQNQRVRALEAFRSGKSPVLVATDIAARGLDIDGITHVFNFDLPMEPEAYVHRIGRTARAGASGVAISFCDAEERGLLRDIEKTIRRTLAVVQTPTGLPEPPAAPRASERPAPQGRGTGGGKRRAGKGGRHDHGRPEHTRSEAAPARSAPAPTRSTPAPAAPAARVQRMRGWGR